jgi:hypothetical protein
MENNDTENSESKTTDKLKPTRAAVQADTKANRARKSNNHPKKRQKWSIRRTWKQASRKTQIRWIAEGIAILTGLGVLSIYTWDHFQRERQFNSEQRPYISVIDVTFFAFPSENFAGKELRFVPSPPVADRPVVAKALFSNVGKSTAYNVLIHRHILLARQISSSFKIEPADVEEKGRTVTVGEQDFTEAITAKDTFSLESGYIPNDQPMPWDGSERIVTFGRITYQDSVGTQYCTYWATMLLQSGASLAIGSIAGRDVSELCPPGTIE